MPPACQEPRRSPDDFRFRTRTGHRLSRDAAARRLSSRARTAAQACPSPLEKSIHPNILRRSCAMSLLQAAVDTAVIALRPGRAGVRSTDAYVHAAVAVLSADNTALQNQGLSFPDLRSQAGGLRPVMAGPGLRPGRLLPDQAVNVPQGCPVLGAPGAPRTADVVRGQHGRTGAVPPAEAPMSNTGAGRGVVRGQHQRLPHSAPL